MTVQSWELFAFPTFHKGATHFYTIKDGKLKFSQTLQIKEILFFNFFFYNHSWKLKKCPKLKKGPN